MDPTEFKELLKGNFDIYLTPGELDAMVRMFDTDGNGGISCVEFMTTFFRIGLKERSRVLEEKREEEARMKMVEIERRRIKVEKAKMATLTTISWPDLPDEDEPDGAWT